MRSKEQKGYEDNSGVEIKFLGEGDSFLINEERLGKGVGAKGWICWTPSAGKTLKDVQEYQSGTLVRSCG